jgi:hypothetical protein
LTFFLSFLHVWCLTFALDGMVENVRCGGERRGGEKEGQGREEEKKPLDVCLDYTSTGNAVARLSWIRG